MMRSTSAAIVLTVTMLLSGCGLISSPDRAVPAGYVERSTITEAARALVGEARARQAADEATAFALITSFQPRLLDPSKDVYSVEELNSAVIQDALAPGTLSLWKQLVVQAAEGNIDAQEEVRGLEMFALRQPTWQVNPDGKIVHSQVISDLEVDVLTGASPATEENQMLKVSFTHEARLRYTEDKHPFELVFTRAVEYHLVPANSAIGRTVPNKITVVTATPAIPSQPRPASSTRPAASSSIPQGTTIAVPTTTTQPANTQPTSTQPTSTQPTSTQPTSTQPTSTQPTDPPATDPPATDPPATDEPATDPPATDPPATDSPATDPPAAGANAFLVPFEVDVSLGQVATPSMAPSVSPTTTRMWQIAVFLGAYDVDAIELPR